MKKILFIFFLFICLISIDNNIYAYNPEEPAQLVSIDCPQNGMILNTNSAIYIKIKVKGIDTAQYNKCRFFISDYSRKDIMVDCIYNEDTDSYEGDYTLSKENDAEVKYSNVFLGIYDKQPGVYIATFNYEKISFVYSDNCYNGTHTGGTAYCSSLPECSICGNEYGSYGDEHIPDPEDGFYLSILPTCAKEGIGIKQCILCRKILETTNIPPTGHRYGELKTLKYPSCKSHGEKGFECQECGEILVTQTIEKTSHSPSEWIVKSFPTCTKNGLKIKYCTNCKITLMRNTLKKSGHDFSKWYVIKKATALHTGKKIRKCFSCEKEKRTSLKKLKANVTLKTKSFSMKRGDIFTLKIKHYTKGDKVKSWKSNNKKIATVNSKGKLTAKKKGNATITVYMKSGAKASCKVKVK